MDNTQIILLVGVFFGVAGLFAAVALVFEKRSGSDDRWGGTDDDGETKAETTKRKKRKRRSGGQSLAVKILQPLSRLWSFGHTSQSRVQELLVHAGIRNKNAVEVFLGAKFALAFALPSAVVAFLMWSGRASGANLLMYGAIGLVAGLILPNMWLRRKANKRMEEVRLSLPDALDLMIVCVESGLGLDAALVRISNELQDVAPELCAELKLLNLEVSAGKPREECLRNLALRTGCEEVESLCARINQAARYGTNLGHSLRIHSESLRQKRRQEAEERAAKTAVKLLFPLVFFIFPAIFVVILGPAAAKVAEQFM
ncbi:MAG: type II secretion system F family protein [Planctomycetota bacterium]